MSNIKLDDEGNPFVGFIGTNSMMIFVKRRLADNYYQVNMVQDSKHKHSLDHIRKHTVFKEDGELWLRYELTPDALTCISDAFVLLRHYEPPADPDTCKR